MPLQPVVFVKAVTSVAQGITLTVENPLARDYEGLPPAGIRLVGENGAPLPDGDFVLARNPIDHRWEGRPLGTAGPWEIAKEQGNWAAYDDGDARLMVGISR